MTAFRRITINFGYLLVSQVFSLAASIGVLAIVVRTLSQADFGVYALIAAASGIIVAVPFAGLTRVLEREMARDRENSAHILASVLLIRLLASTVFFLLLAALLPSFPQALPYRQAIIWAGLWVVVSPLVASYQEVFVAWEKMQYEALLNGLYKAALFLATLAACWAGWGLAGIFAAKVAARIIQLLPSMWLVYTRICPFQVRSRPEFSFYLFRQGLPIEASELLYVLFYQIDEILLARVGGVEMTGLYHGPSKIIQGISLVPQQIMRSSFPSFSRAYARSWDRFKGAYIYGLKLMGFLGLPLTASLCWFAPEIVGLVLDPKYSGSVLPLRLLSFSVLLLFPDTFFRFVLISMGKQIYDTAALGIAVTVKIILQLLLAWLFGLVGACFAALVGQIVMVAIGYYVSVRELGGIPGRTRMLLKPVVATSVMVGAFSLMPWHFLIALPVGFCLYGGTLFAMQAFSPEEMVMMRSLFRKTQVDP